MYSTVIFFAEFFMLIKFFQSKKKLHSHVASYLKVYFCNAYSPCTTVTVRDRSSCYA